MAQHKWHKEICAWADGAEIESRFKNDTTFKEEGNWTEWAEMDDTCRFSEEDWWEYRIKPQPKKPQYLYVYGDSIGRVGIDLQKMNTRYGQPYIGKIKLEQDDES